MAGRAGLSAGNWRFDITDEAATCRLAEDVAAVLQPGDLVTLSGDLGAGKTAFARALIRAAAGDAQLEVPSPTFAIRIDYEMVHLTICHVDLYRIAGDDDADELGLDEALQEAALIVEWPGRITWPRVDNRLDIVFAHSADLRQVEISARGGWPSRFERSVGIREFIVRAGFANARRLHVIGDASSKAFERIVEPGADTAILMNAPERSPGPAVWEGRTYDDVAHRARDILPFLAIGAALEAAGVHVPRILDHQREMGLVLMEDLGAEPPADDAGRPIIERYESAIDLLAFMHGRDWPDRLDCDGETYRVPRYDTDALLIEISLFADWYVPHRRGQAFSSPERSAFLDAWRNILAKLDTTQASWVMRDFHSPNILWQADEDGMRQVGVIDIQDTLIGHPAYDVASLAQDARVDIDADTEAALIQRYCAARLAGQPQFDSRRFAEAYAILGAQRATKVLGAFTRLSFHDGKPGYEAHLPRVEKILARNLAHPVLSGLHVWYAGLS